jgi:hypothetical protein
VNATEELLSFFSYEHLPHDLKTASEPFCVLARSLAATLPENREKTVALRKLLEANDSAVRAVLLARPAK